MKLQSIFAVLVFVTVVTTDPNFEPTYISSRKIIRQPFESNQKDIPWGQGYNTLKLQTTFNSAVKAINFKERSYQLSTIKMKLCQNGGEAYNFITGDLFNAAPFLTKASQILTKFLKASEITELSSVLIIKLDVTTKLKEVDNFELVSNAKELLKRSDFRSFSNFYGTHCLSRVVFGGYLYIALEFSSKSRKEKKILQQHLSWLPHDVGTVSELRDTFQNIKHHDAIEINVFTVGSDKAPPAPDISGIINFAEQFIWDIEHAKVPRVHHIEYHSMLNLYTSTFDFRNFVQPILNEVDTIVKISAGFHDLIFRANSLIELSEKDETFSFLTAAAVENINQAKSRAIKLQNSIKTKFSLIFNKHEMTAIVNEFKDMAKLINDSLTDTVINERYFDTSINFFLRSRGQNRYISIDENNYPKLTETSPIRLKFTLVENDNTNQVEYSAKFYLITSDTTPHYYLCMGKNNWYVFWDHQLNVDINKCSWFLRRSSDMEEFERYVRFSDILLIYNRYWPGYVIGTSEDGRWLLTVPEDLAIQQSKHHWAIEKTPFEISI